jgi:hypothetical protein
LRDFLIDLSKGDPVALAIAGFFVLLALAVAAVWIVDYRRRQRDNKGKKPPAKRRP